jgi:hypothetical protein
MMILKTSRANLSSNDQLSLDLPFAATKSLAARVGPTPTFTRGSGATYIGSDGLIHGVDTSTTSNSISAASKTFTLAATAGQDQFWRAGDAVEASNGANIMAGTVTSYDAATQSLVCNMTTVSGTGTFTSWRIGYRGPRFDHDPVTLACKGLLIEEGRTNICLRSENFGTTWSTFNSSIPLISQVAPNGDPSAYSLVENTGSGTHSIFQSIAFAGTTNYTFSVFVKAGSRNFASLVEQSSGGAVRRTFFNLSTGEVGTKNASHTASTQQLPNGWWRLIISFTSGTASNANIAIELASADNVSSYLGNGSGNAFTWGAQLEAGSFPTSYIPTTTAPLTRSADVCNITGGGFNNFYNQSEGTLFADVSGLMNTTLLGNRSFFAISDGTYNNSLSILKASGIAGIRGEGVTGGGANQFTLSNAYAPFTQYKVALGVKTNDTNMAANGSLKTTDTSVTLPSTMNRLDLRDPTAAAGGHPSGHIAAIRYYKKRLPDAKLVTLTT